MGNNRQNPPGVLCLEGPWSAKLTDRSTVRPLLEVLEEQKLIRYAYRDAVTVAEFEQYMLQWTQNQYADHGFAYLAFHGDPGGFWIGRRFYTLETLAELCEGRLAGRTLYFGACATLKINEETAREFLRMTGARALCGYTKDVDWVESAAFEMILIRTVTNYDRIDAGFRDLQKTHGGLCEYLGLRAVWNGGGIW